MKLRPYQDEISTKACEILQKLKIVYLAMEVRTGKTLTALSVAEKYKANKVLFLTKKKAIDSILSDFKALSFNYEIEVVNDESLHLIASNDFDLIIHDEHHRFGAFPKCTKTAKEYKKRFGNIPMIFLSGTPTPESYAQWYHQFWVSNHSPFSGYKNFYQWANDYCNVVKKNLGYASVNDYSNTKTDLINPIIKDYIITYTQEQAGFKSKINELVIEVPLLPITYNIINILNNKKILYNKDNRKIVAETSLKLMQKTHQLFSGTIKFEDGTSKVIDYSKANYIKEAFKDNKIGIFYKYKEEFNALKDTLGDLLTDDLEEFNTTNKWIALQVVSGREGISLKNADALVYYNIDFSAVSYWQSRDRLTTIERPENNVFYIFSKGGIETKIYQQVLQKRDYTLSLYKNDFGTSNTIKN